MLHTRLLEILNSGQAWAFVGSGPSSDAGMPSWRDLLDAVAEDPTASSLLAERSFTGARDSGNYPRCFSLIESAIGREALEARVRSSLGAVTTPGDMYRLLADLPFAGYITTNYDGLLEAALAERAHGWTAVGNTSTETRKVSGGAPRVVWHVHGSLALAPQDSRLVLTTRDYDDLYLEDSPVLRQLRALMSQRRIVVVGFGFADQEVLRLLRRVGQMTDPTRPVFAFLPKKGDFGTTTGRALWLHESNIDVLPYRIRASGHRALTDLLTVYASLSLRRSIRFRGERSTPPSYDPETTGLLIYNELVLSRGVNLPSDIRGPLLRARLLAQLHNRSGLTSAELARGVSESAQKLSHRVLGVLGSVEVTARVNDALTEMSALGFVSVDPSTGRCSLTDAGTAEVADHAATAGRIESQFSSSLRTRADRVCADGAVAERVAAATEAFLKDCIEKRALGVAMAINVKQAAQQDYHLLALLQSLGEYLSRLDDEEEARRLLEVVQEVLRAPSEAEREYIGITLQARFGVHLLGYDDATLRVRLADVAKTAFIIDSTSLIALLARSSPNSDMSSTLFSELQRCGASIVTTPLLAAELTEHIQWAQSRVAEGGGSFQSVPVLEAVTGRAGQRSNAFLDGFAAELAEGRSVTFAEYVREVCSLDVAVGRITRQQIRHALASRGVNTVQIEDCEGFTPALRMQIDEHQAQLHRLRESAETFTREVQVEAEAEALSIVEGIRAGKLQLEGGQCNNAYFISNTRIIDQVAHSDIPITMKPDAALQWLMTLHPCPVDELRALTSGLLWELQERGQDLVDTRTLLIAFGPLIEASESARDVEIARLRSLTGQVFAGAAESLERAPKDIDMPVTLESHNAQMVRELQLALENERKRADAAEQERAMSDADRLELERLREKEQRRSKYKRMVERQKPEGKRGRHR